MVLSMNNSILHFNEFGVKNLEKVMENFSEDMTKVAEMVKGVTENVVNLGLSIIAEELEEYDEWLRKSSKRKEEWQIVKRDETTLLTSLGSVTYKKTLFISKKTGEREYLLDRAMNMEKHARMTEDAEARILEEAVETSYRKGGDNASIGNENVSKQTVKNKIHELKFPKAKVQSELKEVPYVYIDADEDHVSLQYLQEKGDIPKRKRINTIMPKIVYVYEGIEYKNGKNVLINPKYFGGVYEGGKANKELWNEVWEYIDQSYDVDAIKKIYINGDGASWIKQGAKIINNSKFILDKFHMSKYIIAATSHLKEDVEIARSELYKAIYKRQKWYAEKTFNEIIERTETETKLKTVLATKTYILDNWAGIMEQIKNKDAEIKCSAEGHVSHVFVDRMSSRPLGWSRCGADKMARLRIYYQNKGDMLELVRYQREELQKVSGGEDITTTCGDIIRAEQANRKRLGALANVPTYSIPYAQVKKIANFRRHIWGL